jgi:hypothetical protein
MAPDKIEKERGYLRISMKQILENVEGEDVQIKMTGVSYGVFKM